ncbi:retrovirus-related pol polyprotein from transposon TNT 1-94 [Tanacetum coccineum]
MGIMIRNKERLVAQGYTQEKGIDYDEVFAPVARIGAIRLFLAYASFKDFVVYQMDVKSAFHYRKIEEEVYVCQQPGFEDPDFLDRVYKVEKALYGLHQAPRACYETLSTYLLDNGFTEVKTASTPIETQKPLLKDEDGEEVDVHMYRMLTYLKGQPKLGLWYPKDSPFDLVAYTNSDYARASLDRRSTTGGKAKKSVKLMMEKLFKMELELMLVTQNTHNMITFLSKPAESDGFKQIVDFLNAQPIRYALTVNPTIYITCIEQFWSTLKAKTINGEVQLHALVDGKKIIVTEAFVRRDLQLEVEEGIDCLPNSTIFEQLALMGYEKI